LLGGYASASWDVETQFKPAVNSFIFTLTNPHALPPTRYFQNILNRTEYGIISDANYGPCFGGNWDIFIEDQCNEKPSGVDFPHSYKDTTLYGENTFTNSASFTVSEIQVFSLEK